MLRGEMGDLPRPVYHCACYNEAMSISGYFGSTKELRMPRKPNPQGIHFYGEVLTGEQSVEQKQRHESLIAHDHTREAYKNARDYDPVLRFHLRLPENEISKPSEPKLGEIQTPAPTAENKMLTNEPGK